jgi:endonuclease/exonuclease/phosphatase family metal-dependent hydrolase
MAPERNRDSIRIATYNLYGLRGFPQEHARARLGDPNGESAARYFSEVLDALRCDLIAIQEGASEPQMRRIAENLGFELAMFPSPVRWPGYLLSAFPIRDIHSLAPEVADYRNDALSRSAGVARVEIPRTGTLRIVGVHLHPKRADIRATEAEMIAGEIDRTASDGERTIVVGDFNCEPPERFHRELTARGFVNVRDTSAAASEPTRAAEDGRAPLRRSHLRRRRFVDANRRCRGRRPARFSLGTSRIRRVRSLGSFSGRWGTHAPERSIRRTGRPHRLQRPDRFAGPDSVSPYPFRPGPRSARPARAGLDRASLDSPAVP